MKKIAAIIAVICSLSIMASWGFFKKSNGPNYERLQTGDIVFQELGGPQGQAVKAATNSPFTHCGVVFEQDGTLYVLEAVQPVSVTTLKNFRKRSRVFHARRLKDPSVLNARNLGKALTWGRQQIGKDYDPLFKWDDKNLYCSELVWKVYQKAANLELCPTKTFKSYFLEKPEVQRIIRQRYGAAEKLPVREPVVAPSDLARSTHLREVPRRK